MFRGLLFGSFSFATGIPWPGLDRRVFCPSAALSGGRPGWGWPFDGAGSQPVGGPTCGENGGLTDDQIRAADVDQDGRITEADWQVLQQRIQAATDVPTGQVQLDSAYSGQVVDRLTGQPLAGAEVAIPGAGISVRTDAQGRFRLPGPLPAEEILVARLENYLPYSQSTGNGQASGDRPWQLQLERWDPNTTLVLEANVIRLGDNQYSPESAAAGQFLGPAQGGGDDPLFHFATPAFAPTGFADWIPDWVWIQLPPIGPVNPGSPAPICLPCRSS
jgi:hypothetical protein